MITKIVYFLIIFILSFIMFEGVRAAVIGIKAKKKYFKKFNRNKKK